MKYIRSGLDLELWKGKIERIKHPNLRLKKNSKGARGMAFCRNLAILT